jgi:hypothetical protein
MRLIMSCSVGVGGMMKISVRGSGLGMEAEEAVEGAIELVAIGSGPGFGSKLEPDRKIALIWKRKTKPRGIIHRCV